MRWEGVGVLLCEFIFLLVNCENLHPPPPPPPLTHTRTLYGPLKKPSGATCLLVNCNVAVSLYNKNQSTKRYHTSKQDVEYNLKYMYTI